MKMTAKFHLPGLRYNYPLNMMLLSLKEKYPHYFQDNIEIASFFGEFPTSLWNGGRFSNGDQCNRRFVEEVVKSINTRGIPVRYTYTNPLLTEEDLADAYCNFCMKTADNGKNEVLVVSPILEAYIRKNYPGFTINSSTCKEIRGIEGVNEELKKDYGLVVLDYNLNNQFGELQKITDKSRCELLVNACCIPECPRRGEHYRTIAKQQRITLKNRRHPADKQIPVPGWHCEYGNCNTIYDIQEYKTFISAEDIWEKYLPMGFCNFKIEGRTADYFNLIDTYCYYLMEPKYRDEARLLLLMNLERSRVIRVSKPKPGNWQ